MTSDRAGYEHQRQMQEQGLPAPALDNEPDLMDINRLYFQYYGMMQPSRTDYGIPIDAVFLFIDRVLKGETPEGEHVFLAMMNIITAAYATGTQRYRDKTKKSGDRKNQKK